MWKTNIINHRCISVLEDSRPVSVSRPVSSPFFDGLGLGLGLQGLGLGLGSKDSMTRTESWFESLKKNHYLLVKNLRFFEMIKIIKQRETLKIAIASTRTNSQYRKYASFDSVPNFALVNLLLRSIQLYITLYSAESMCFRLLCPPKNYHWCLNGIVPNLNHRIVLYFSVLHGYHILCSSPNV